MKRHNYLLLIIAILVFAALVVQSATAAKTAVLTFERQSHHSPQLDTELLCDGESLGVYTLSGDGTAPTPYSLAFSFSDCEALTVQFTGTVWSGLGQKIDNVALSVDGGANLLINGDFADGLNGWDNPDIGTDGINGGWQWAVSPKEDAKLDISGSGSNAAAGEPYRLLQVVNIGGGGTPTATPFSGTATPNPEMTPTPGGHPACEMWPHLPMCQE